MHMADALVSPAVGGVMWAAAGGVGLLCARRVRERIEGGTLPLMGVAGAFVFAAQMINFTIPATGSSGHLGGGLLLAAMLGPHAAFLAMASVLTIQALLFADGGLLALGCNVFNLGFLPAFVAYPLVYRPLARGVPSRARLTVAAVLAAVLALQLGALGVVLQTTASGISALPLVPFLLLMQPVHLAIGLVEGLATAAVLLFVREARPEVLEAASDGGDLGRGAMRATAGALLLVALLTGGALSWLASTRPDGLEWSIAGVTGSEELPAPETRAHGALAALQERVALLPDYGFRSAGEASEGEHDGTAWPAPDVGTSVSGLVGSALTLALLVLVVLALRWARARPRGGTS